MKRFKAVFKKELRQISRDPLSLALLIFVPVMLLVLYGYALSFDVKHIAVAVLDQECSLQSRELLDSLFQNPYFDRAGTLSRLDEANSWLDGGKARAVLVVPVDYTQRLSRNERVGIPILVDGSDATAASTAIGYFDALADRWTRQIRFETIARTGLPHPLPFVQIESRFWFNPEMQSSHFLVPGLIAMLLMLSSVIATSLSIVREKERQTMEQIMVSPLRPLELILGKTLPYLLISVLTMIMILVLGYLLFGIVIQGSYGLLALATLLFLFAALGMGMLISSITKSQQVAFQIATMATLLPSIILSGLIFSIQNMPWPIKLMTLLVVPRYFVTILRGIILKAADFSVLWPYLLGMLILGFVFNLLALRNTRKAL